MASEARATRSRARGRGSWLQTVAAAAAGAGLAWFAASTLQSRDAVESNGDAEFVAHPRALEEGATAAPGASTSTDANPSAASAPADVGAVPAAAATAAESVLEARTDPPAAAPQSVTEPPNPSVSDPAAQVMSSTVRTATTDSADLAMRPTMVRRERPQERDVTSAEQDTSIHDISVADSARQPLAAQPETVLEDEATRVRIPFDGDLDGMRSVIWADPLALAIELPNGRTAVAEGRYPIGAGGVTDLRVNRRGHTLLIRVRLSSQIGRYEITAEGGTFEARLEPAATLAR
jgi:hypothetical protein